MCVSVGVYVRCVVCLCAFARVLRPLRVDVCVRVWSMLAYVCVPVYVSVFVCCVFVCVRPCVRAYVRVLVCVSAYFANPR